MAPQNRPTFDTMSADYIEIVQAITDHVGPGKVRVFRANAHRLG